jgi:hypothetical protein
LLVVEHQPDSLHRLVLERAQSLDPGASRNRRVVPKPQSLLLSLLEYPFYSHLLRLVQIEGGGKLFDALIKAGTLGTRMRGWCGRGRRNRSGLS